MDHETMRFIAGGILLCGAVIAAAVFLLKKYGAQIKEVCTDEEGRFDPLGGLERHFRQDEEPVDPERQLAEDNDFMAILMRQKGAQMAGFDPEREQVREHIIFHGRVQGVGFRYQAMHAAASYGLTGWVENLPDGTVEMEVQGAPAAIGRLISHLRSGSWIRIDKMDVEERPLAAGERRFGVRGY